MLKKVLILLFILALSSVSLSFAQSDVTAVTLVDLNMRNAPRAGAEVITKLPAQTQVVVEGRDSTQGWLLVHTTDLGARGWMAIQYLRLDQAVSIRNLTDMSDVDLSVPLTPGQPGEPTAPVIPPERTDYPPLWLGDAVMRNARAIYTRGQQRGNNPNMLIKIGESNMAGTVFLCTFNYGNYDLGSYPELKPIVDRFNSTGSFCNYDYTARSGFASANLLDPQWAIEPECHSGETPLQCSYRIYKPSYALIYLGIADMGFYTTKQFHDNLIKIIQYLSNNGVVPVLSTFPMADSFNDGKPQLFNAVVRDVATTEKVPLMDIRSVLYTYENRGMGPDGYHFSVRDESFTSFAGDEKYYGRTERELLTLQMLSQIAF